MPAPRLCRVSRAGGQAEHGTWASLGAGGTERKEGWARRDTHFFSFEKEKKQHL